VQPKFSKESSRGEKIGIARATPRPKKREIVGGVTEGLVEGKDTRPTTHLLRAGLSRSKFGNHRKSENVAKVNGLGWVHGESPRQVGGGPKESWCEF